jgi:hypothetical protein
MKNGASPKAKSSLRPARFLLHAYLPEHYKNRTGFTRKVLGKDLGRDKKIPIICIGIQTLAFKPVIHP